MRSFSSLLRTVLRFFNSCVIDHDLTECRRQGNIPAGQALSLQARRAGILHSSSGCLWVTFSRASEDASVRGGDHFLAPGESLAMVAGQRVVLESHAVGVNTTFVWEPAAGSRLAGIKATAWRGGLTGDATKPASPARSLAVWTAPFAAVTAWCCCAHPRRSGSCVS